MKYILFAVFLVGAMLFMAGCTSPNDPQTTVEEEVEPGPESEPTTLDLTQLPLGNDKVSDAPQVEYIYSCQTSFNGGGAFKAGPWINEENGTWDLTQKITVDGSVTWENAKSAVSNEGTTRTFTSNGLPDHSTGIYPVQSTDDAYQYDRNPNSIREQSLEVDLPTNPTLLTEAQCVGGHVGILLSGIPIYNGFDAGGRDAVAMEIQDDCSGHPQEQGQYHYHGYSPCLEDDTDKDEHSALMGYAFDGFGIYGLKGEFGFEVWTQDLDECHGHTHTIAWESEKVEMYHYHLTMDFPYSVSCFRGESVVKGTLK